MDHSNLRVVHRPRRYNLVRNIVGQGCSLPPLDWPECGTDTGNTALRLNQLTSHLTQPASPASTGSTLPSQLNHPGLWATDVKGPNGAPSALRFEAEDPIKIYKKGTQVTQRAPQDGHLQAPNTEQDTSHRVIRLYLKNTYTIQLTDVSVSVIKVDMPELMEVGLPHRLSLPDHINPVGYLEIELADYQENPSATNFCLNTLNSAFVRPCLLRTLDTSVEYTFFASAAESISAAIKVKIWIEEGRLRYRASY